ncbi:hypothetical protein FA95DRAFT_127261 [Auriscalpium vulgare]|uniref:Uncharacterized protein n=1 Tax=Auriscalpium vulgare TaxID=40419 RepID=A0ACB8RND2_9AGAM|nr:hypothetical protein FA95DRAFT_127261 [Auriscalpium vulgare]
MSSPSPSPPISRLTNEVLQEIFSNMNPEPRAWRELEPHSELTELALVSKRWADVAKRELLTHVYLCELSDDAQRLKSFRDMLRASPTSAAIVRGIHFGSWMEDIDEIENETLGEILTLCPNLVEVRLQGCMPNTAPLVQALAACPKLQKVYISDRPIEHVGCECDPFCTAPEFLTMLQSSWPAIQSVTLADGAVGPREDEEDVASTWTTLANSCPFLTRLEISCPAAVQDQYLLALSEIAPSISSLELDNGQGNKNRLTEAALTTILNRWGASMTSLTIIHWQAPYPGEEYYSARLDPVLSAMPVLRDLSITSSYLSPTSLACDFGALAVLEYEIRAEEGAAVTSALRETGSMPALRKVKISLRERPAKLSSDLNDLLDGLRDSCKSRGIDFDDEGLRKQTPLLFRCAVVDVSVLEDR